MLSVVWKRDLFFLLTSQIRNSFQCSFSWMNLSINPTSTPLASKTVYIPGMAPSGGSPLQLLHVHDPWVALHLQEKCSERVNICDLNCREDSVNQWHVMSHVSCDVMWLSMIWANWCTLMHRQCGGVAQFNWPNASSNYLNLSSQPQGLMNEMKEMSEHLHKCRAPEDQLSDLNSAGSVKWQLEQTIDLVGPFCLFNSNKTTDSKWVDWHHALSC